MKILALDLASLTGWSHTCGTSGVWDLRAQRDESTGYRLIRLGSKLEMIHRSVGIDLVAFEEMSAMSGKSANMTAVKFIDKMIAIVMYLVEGWDGVEYKAFNNSRIKAHAFRHAKKGTSRDKAAITEAAQKHWPDLDVIDDNHADALWLLDLACEDLGIWPKPEFSGKE